MKGGFICSNCGQWVSFSEDIGTRHRNHCPFCLWSKHVDLEVSGDRKSDCKSGMKPIGLTFKQEGRDKYRSARQGEIMLIHECLGCKKISLNRIAGDDDPENILKVLKESQQLPPDKKNRLQENNIKLISDDNKKEVLGQLFGKDFRSVL